MVLKSKLRLRLLKLPFPAVSVFIYSSPVLPPRNSRLNKVFPLLFSLSLLHCSCLFGILNAYIRSVRPAHCSRFYKSSSHIVYSHYLEWRVTLFPNLRLWFLLSLITLDSPSFTLRPKLVGFLFVWHWFSGSQHFIDICVLHTFK